MEIRAERKYKQSEDNKQSGDTSKIEIHVQTMLPFLRAKWRHKQIKNMHKMEIKAKWKYKQNGDTKADVKVAVLLHLLGC